MTTGPETRDGSTEAPPKAIKARSVSLATGLGTLRNPRNPVPDQLHRVLVHRVRPDLRHPDLVVALERFRAQPQRGLVGLAGFQQDAAVDPDQRALLVDVAGVRIDQIDTPADVDAGEVAVGAVAEGAVGMHVRSRSGLHARVRRR